MSKNKFVDISTQRMQYKSQQARMWFSWYFIVYHYMKLLPFYVFTDLNICNCRCWTLPCWTRFCRSLDFRLSQTVIGEIIHKLATFSACTKILINLTLVETWYDMICMWEQTLRAKSILIKKQRKLNQISGANRQERVEMMRGVAFFLCSQEGEFVSIDMFRVLC